MQATIENKLAGLKVGDEVHVGRGYRYGVTYTAARVVRVVGNKVCVVYSSGDREHYFDLRDGRVIGDEVSRRWIEPDSSVVAEAKGRKLELRRVGNVVEEIRTCLDEHKNGFGSYKFDAATKAKLMEMVNRL